MPGHVSLGGEGLSLLHLGEPEVEDGRRDPGTFREQHVRRLDVTVDDPAPVRVREGLEHLRARLDGVGVVELAASQRLAERPPGTYS